MSVPTGGCSLGLRGYQITEAGAEVGGCVARECRLPSLSAWGRVGDYREYQLSQMPNVDVYFESRLSAQDILAFGFQNIAIATGSTWPRDGVARISSRCRWTQPWRYTCRHVARPAGYLLIGGFQFVYRPRRETPALAPFPYNVCVPPDSPACRDVAG